MIHHCFDVCVVQHAGGPRTGGGLQEAGGGCGRVREAGPPAEGGGLLPHLREEPAAGEVGTSIHTNMHIYVHRHTHQMQMHIYITDTQPHTHTCTHIHTHTHANTNWIHNHIDRNTHTQRYTHTCICQSNQILIYTDFSLSLSLFLPGWAGAAHPAHCPGGPPAPWGLSLPRAPNWPSPPATPACCHASATSMLWSGWRPRACCAAMSATSPWSRR